MGAFVVAASIVSALYLSSTAHDQLTSYQETYQEQDGKSILTWANQSLHLTVDASCEPSYLPQGAMYDKNRRIIEWRAPDYAGEFDYSLRCTDDSGVVSDVIHRIYVMKLEDVTIPIPTKQNEFY